MRILAGSAKQVTGSSFGLTPLSIVSDRFSKILSLLALGFLCIFYPRLSIFQCSSIRRSSGLILDQAGLLGAGLFDYDRAVVAAVDFFSSLTSQQVSFLILGVFLCFVLYFGFSAAGPSSGQFCLLVGELSLSFNTFRLSRE